MSEGIEQFLKNIGENFYVLSFLFFSFISKLNKYGIKQFGKGISIKKISRQRIFPPRRFPATDADYQLVVVLRVLSPHPWNEEPRCVDLFVGPFRGPDGTNTTETDCAARTGRVWGQIKNQFERTALIRKCSTGCSSSPDSTCTDSSRSVIRAKSSKPNGRHPLLLLVQNISVTRTYTYIRSSRW